MNKIVWTAAIVISLIFYGSVAYIAWQNHELKGRNYTLTVIVETLEASMEPKHIHRRRGIIRKEKYREY